MKRKWQLAAFALALAGLVILVPRPGAARQTHPSYTRQQNAKMRREIRQDKRQIRQRRRDSRGNRSQLKTARRQYAQGAQKGQILRSDIRQAKQTASAVRKERDQQFHLHRRQVAHPVKKK